MQQTESALGDAGELMQQARELIVSAGNGSYSDAERAQIGQRIRGLRDQLFALANRADGAGGYLFGGQGRHCRRSSTHPAASPSAATADKRTPARRCR